MTTLYATRGKFARVCVEIDLQDLWFHLLQSWAICNLLNMKHKIFFRSYGMDVSRRLAHSQGSLGLMRWLMLRKEDKNGRQNLG